ncbi:response regulator [Pontibacter arcticus]|uniref:DNA-binding response regulator n=1 Tax=Pontibacter arcticus TaxID=2080288 RepID=A0A364RDX8_9BACT|nr:response regulator transcription factor [Pontibacter arcticus]RAU82492.1 DNA-binding response regulator [Pontibacter arcticus]
MEFLPFTLALADDHTLFRKGIVEILKLYPEVTLVAEAVNGARLLEKIENKMPDIVMLDLEMPEMDGIATARYLLIKYPQVKVLIMSMYGEETLVEKLLEEGVHGYLLKSAEPAELRQALQALKRGEKLNYKLAHNPYLL